MKHKLLLRLVVWTSLLAATAGTVVVHAAGPVSADTSDSYWKLTPAEASWCRWPSRLKLCKAVYMNEANWAMANATDCDTPTPCANGDEQNAFQHCLWSAIMTLRHGRNTANGFLTRHESKSDGDDDSKRDWNNNSVGFLIAEQSDDH